MSAWEASEAVIEDMVIRLMTYRRSGQAKLGINRPCVWFATIKNIYAERVNQSANAKNIKSVRALPGRGRPTVILMACVKAPVRESDNTTE